MARHKSVLLVEDDPITIMVCERILQLTGFAESVSSATNGAEAIEYLSQLSQADKSALPSVIFLDINMPVMNGWEFLENFESIRHYFDVMPIIYVLSSTVDPEDSRRAESFGIVQRFISKPLTKDILDSIK